jgi:hypothetical protein
MFSWFDKLKPTHARHVHHVHAGGSLLTLSVCVHVCCRIVGARAENRVCIGASRIECAGW